MRLLKPVAVYGATRPGPFLKDADDYDDCIVIKEFYCCIGWRFISTALFIVLLDVFLAKVSLVRLEMLDMPDYCFCKDCFFIILLQNC